MPTLTKVTGETMKHPNARVQTEIEEIAWREGSAFFVIDDLNWIEVEFIDGEFRITPYHDTEVVIDEDLE